LGEKINTIKTNTSPPFDAFIEASLNVSTKKTASTYRIMFRPNNTTNGFSKKKLFQITVKIKFIFMKKLKAN
jgi:hypothetical protein